MMPPGVRKVSLAVHLTVSVGWIGSVAAYLALDVTTATSEDPSLLRAAYVGMEMIARSVIVPFAAASLLTGLLMSLGTKWGLIRHYWVLISFVLTVLATLVLLTEIRTISALAGMAADEMTTDAHLRSMRSTLVHSVGGAVVLVVILVLNLFKPQGMTRYGWRAREREKRRARSDTDVGGPG
jgi:hypothetical protein